MSLLEKIMSIIAPHECLSCQKEGLLLCVACQEMLPLPDPINGGEAALDSLFAATVYEGIAKQLVQSLKFERKRAAGEVLAAMLAARMPAVCRYDAIVHLPTATRRIRTRGYDQAELVAYQLSKLLDVPAAPLLFRTGQQRQLGQSRSVRMRQMRTAFRVTDQQRVNGLRLLLIDDVLTTGASLHGAAAALKDAGALQVDGAVFAVVTG